MPHTTTAAAAPAQANYYTLLSLPPPPHILPLTPGLLKKHYHRALLQHHPDKASARANSQSTPSTATTTATTPASAAVVSVDLLSAAYTTLASPTLRAEYDRSLTLSSGAGAEGAGEAGAAGPHASSVVQAVDLDEFTDGADENGARFTRACRCGEKEGYVVTEYELEQAAAEMEVLEVLVACAGCSLWCRVGFGVVEEEEEGREGREGRA
ncbi:hypothetical protein EDC01DRAFT_778317 [Geopyxis carbonaria]|nr:hypothetical protein EDC01DRAFT_778317 [Geopyxis carbonaria]